MSNVAIITAENSGRHFLRSPANDFKIISGSYVGRVSDSVTRQSQAADVGLRFASLTQPTVGEVILCLLLIGNFLVPTLCVGMQSMTLCVTERGAFLYEFPRRPWELGKNSEIY